MRNSGRDRLCKSCRCKMNPFTAEDVAARLRKLLAEVGKSRRLDPDARDERIELRAWGEWHMTAHAVMRVNLEFLAADAEGICAACVDARRLALER